MKPFVGLTCLVLSCTIAQTVGASDASCADRMAGIKAEIDAMPGDSDKNLAEHQFKKAQERQSAGKEKSCLRYLESARAAIEADRMHDAD